jgi:transposase InsO family protein
VIQELQKTQVANLRELCQLLGVSRSAYYAWDSREPCSRQWTDCQLAHQVDEIFKYHKRRYGARRISAELRDKGFMCDRKKVRKLMKSLGIQAIQPKSFKPRSTESRHRLGYNENLLIDSQRIIDSPCWVGDITYIPCAECRFCYLAALMELRSRKIVGWHLAMDMTEELVLAALKMAIEREQPVPGIIHHTDRGGQYAGNSYRAILARGQFRQSMSRPDNCYDNAFMESCFGTIKRELEMTEYPTAEEALLAVRRYIAYYNFERKHSALGYRTPMQAIETQF